MILLKLILISQNMSLFLSTEVLSNGVFMMFLNQNIASYQGKFAFLI